jgi:tRNA A37 threonylcarbamoyladenosine biosynthesis protein TsaE
MMAANLTFDEAIDSPTFNLMARQRLKIMRDDITNKLSAVL